MSSSKASQVRVLSATRLVRAALALGVLLVVTAVVGAGEEPAWLVSGPAVAGVLDKKQLYGGFVEYRAAWNWRKVHPWVAMNVGQNGPFFVGAGGVYPIELGAKWRLSLSFGPGFYESNGRFQLGSHLEFLSTAEISRVLPWGDRVGLSFGHISNGSVGKVNPGSEFVKLSYQLAWR